jgi:hypothetical protein
MDPTTTQWRFKVGDQVVSADDQKLGKVVRILPDSTRPTHLVVEKGRLIHHDYRVPVSAVTNYERDTIYLNLTEAATREADLEDAGRDQGTTTEGFIG